MTGRFISLEGGEGCGKSTQAKALAAVLEARGIDVLLTREPGGTSGAEAIRELLLDKANDWPMSAEALLFAAARADHVANVIRPALAKGRWVLCDRYVDSSRAYQTAGDEIDDDAIMALHAIGAGGLLPDRTFILTLPEEVAARRAAARDRGDADRIGGRDADYQQRVAANFLTIARAEPKRVQCIDADGSVEDVTARLLAALSDWLAS